MEEYKFLIGKEGLATRLFGVKERDLKEIIDFINDNSKTNLVAHAYPATASTLNDIPGTFTRKVNGRNIFATVYAIYAGNLNLEGFYEDIAKSKYHIIEMGPAGEAVRC